MSVIHTFKEAKTTSQGLWVKSADGGPEIFLTASEAMALAEQIMAQARPSQRSTTPARSAQRAAAPILYSAPANRVTDVRRFEGKSSFTDPKMLEHAKSLAKQRATKKLNGYLQQLANEGKTFGTGRSQGQHIVNGNSVKYVITATLE